MFIPSPVLNNVSSVHEQAHVDPENYLQVERGVGSLFSRSSGIASGSDPRTKFGLMRAEDLPEWFRGQTWVEPELTIRARDGKIHPEYSAVKLAIGFPP